MAFDETDAPDRGLDTYDYENDHPFYRDCPACGASFKFLAAESIARYARHLEGHLNDDQDP